MIVSIPAPTNWQHAAADPQRLAAARLQLHHAAQLVTLVGRSLLPARSDDSQTAMAWLPEARLLAGEPVAGWRAALRLADLSLHFLRDDGAIDDSLPLSGRTAAQGFAWLQAEAARRGLAADRLNRAVPYALGDHPVAQGAPFHLEPPGDFSALDHLYGNAFALLSTLTLTPAADPSLASPVRCWPHHFDLATLITLGGSGETARTVGVGLSPGDESYPEPYFYVTPWPYPQGVTLPALPEGGRWHTAGWTGAVLTASMLCGGSGAGEGVRAAVFLETAINTALHLAGAA